MKVYVITQGIYSDYQICAVTLDKQEAERLARIYRDGCDLGRVEEYDTDDHQPLLQGRNPYTVLFYTDTGHTSVYFKENPGAFNPGIELGYCRNVDRVNLYAADGEAALKIAAEKRAQARAEMEGLI